MESNRFFRYRTGNTFLHRLHPTAKILLMLALAIVSFYLPIRIALLSFVCVLVAEKALHFTVQEIITDLKPAFFYAIVLYLASFSQNALVCAHALEANNTLSLTTLFSMHADYRALAIHLALSLAVSALFYRTTSNVQFHEGFTLLELAVTRKKKETFSDRLSLTLTFIPQIVANWEQITHAWQGRNGKNGIRKLLTLIPLLFSVSMKHAYDTALAIENRRS